MDDPGTAQGDPVLRVMFAQMGETADLIAAADDLNDILRTLAQRARDLTGADFAAIATFDNEPIIERFVFVGMDDATARRLGTPPAGRGLLGDLAGADRPIRLDDLQQDPRFSGWPAGHPDMGPFLGVPVHAGGRTIGSLYMTRGSGAPPFTEAHELAAALLGLQAAGAVSLALARQRSGRVLLLEERVRIAHDLHDGTIQTLYALGLEADSLAGRPDFPEEARNAFARTTGHLNQLIADIRQYIAMLETKAPGSQPELARDLASAVRQVVPDGVDTIVNITAPALQELTTREAEDLLYIAREALSNACRHSAATRIAVDLRQTGAETALTIQDNGCGFVPEAVRVGLGTITMRTRAERIGGQLTVLSIPGMGTAIRVALPRSLDE